MPEESRNFRTEDREVISRMKKTIKSHAVNARTIEFSESTISKELRAEVLPTQPDASQGSREAKHRAE